MFSTGKSSTLDLDTLLLGFSDHEDDTWSYHIFGGTGSPAAIALSYLRSGLGGLVLAASNDERMLWERHARATGREDDLIIFSPENPWRFNFLRYEQERKGVGAGLTENIVSLFIKAMDVNRSSEPVPVISLQRGQNGANEAFWHHNLRQLLRNSIDLLKLAGEAVSLPGIYSIVCSAPRSFDEVRKEDWQQTSVCAHYLEKAHQRKGTFSAAEDNDFSMTADYFFDHFPNLSANTRSVIVNNFTSMADVLLRGLLRDLLCGDLNVTPEDTHEGKVILVDMPVRVYADIGQYVQIVFRYVWQQAAERRKVDSSTLPIFLWSDESQLTATSNDFQATAPSASACTVYLTKSKRVAVITTSNEKTPTSEKPVESQSEEKAKEPKPKMEPNN